MYLKQLNSTEIPNWEEMNKLLDQDDQDSMPLDWERLNALERFLAKAREVKRGGRGGKIKRRSRAKFSKAEEKLKRSIRCRENEESLTVGPKAGKRSKKRSAALKPNFENIDSESSEEDDDLFKNKCKDYFGGIFRALDIKAKSSNCL